MPSRAIMQPLSLITCVISVAWLQQTRLFASTSVNARNMHTLHQFNSRSIKYQNVIVFLRRVTCSA